MSWLRPADTLAPPLGSAAEPFTAAPAAFPAHWPQHIASIIFRRLASGCQLNFLLSAFPERGLSDRAAARSRRRAPFGGLRRLGSGRAAREGARGATLNAAARLHVHAMNSSRRHLLGAAFARHDPPRHLTPQLLQQHGVLRPLRHVRDHLRDQVVGVRDGARRPEPVEQLPVLDSVGDVGQPDRAYWALRTWVGEAPVAVRAVERRRREVCQGRVVDPADALALAARAGLVCPAVDLIICGRFSPPSVSPQTPRKLRQSVSGAYRASHRPRARR